MIDCTPQIYKCNFQRLTFEVKVFLFVKLSGLRCCEESSKQWLWFPSGPTWLFGTVLDRIFKGRLDFRDVLKIDVLSLNIVSRYFVFAFLQLYFINFNKASY